MSKKYLAYFAGYGPQYWMNIVEPTIYGLADGITVCEVDPDSGKMKVINGTHGEDSPATLVLSPDGKYLYAANELSNFKGVGYGGGLTAYRIDGEGGIEKINDSLAGGACTAYITTDRTGRFLLVANHGSYYISSQYEFKDGEVIPKPVRDKGTVSLFEVREDGGIGKFLDLKEVRGTYQDNLSHSTGHPHSVLISDDDYVVVPDKGGDAVYVYRLDRQNKKLVETDLFEAGYNSCPRHAMFVKDTPYVLVQNEFDGHLCSYELNRDTGKLKAISRIDTWDKSIKTKGGLVTHEHPWGCDVQIHPNKKFVYTDNSQNIVCLFYFDDADGKLTYVKNFRLPEECEMCRGIQISPDGRFICVTGVMTNKAWIYSIDPDSGDLSFAGDIELPTPTALRYQYPKGE